MGKQLNVRSDEAFLIAHRVADITGKPVAEVVLDALREHGAKFTDRSNLTPTQQADLAALRALSRRAASKQLPGVTTQEIMDSLFDEFGLPV